MIIETWEGTHNTLCLQIERDAAKSDLLDRWHAEISVTLSEWPRSFLPRTLARFDQTFRQTLEEVSTDRLRDRDWAAANARRVVDRLGGLLELAWMVSSALHRSSADETPALLAVASAHSLLPNLNVFDESAFHATRPYWPGLIDEAPISASVRDF